MLYTAKEVARELKVHPEHVRRMTRRGDMEPALVSKIGSHWRYGKLDPRRKK